MISSIEKWEFWSLKVILKKWEFWCGKYGNEK